MKKLNVFFLLHLDCDTRLKQIILQFVKKAFKQEAEGNLVALEQTFLNALDEKQKENLSNEISRINNNLFFAAISAYGLCEDFFKTFTNEQLKCIIHSILEYQNSPYKRHFNVRNYIHHFILYHGDEIYSLGNLKKFKKDIGYKSLGDFQQFEEIILILCLDTNNVDFFKKLLNNTYQGELLKPQEYRISKDGDISIVS